MSFSNFTQREKKLTVYLALTIVISLIIISTSRFGGFKERLIDGDGKGYYAYLPALFIHHTLDFTPIFEFEKENLSKDYLGHYFIDHEDIKINKYYGGVALLMLPFFLMGLFFTWMFGLEMTGYSILFQYAVLLGSITYGILGLFYAYRLLRSYHFSERVSLIVILLLLFGTNLFSYVFMMPAASHVYSFFTASLFLYFARKTLLKFSPGSCLLASASLALIILIRPVNGIIILTLPFLAGGYNQLRDSVLQWLRSGKTLLWSFLIVAFIISLQLIVFYIQTGKLYVWTYQGEGFRLNTPEISNFLCSFRKGFFVYTPLMVLAVLGLMPLAKKSLYLAMHALIFLVIVVYLLSSWWSWFYGDSFGMRPMIDFYPFLAILLGFFLSWSRNRFFQCSIGLVIICFVFLNLFQTYQYEHRIIAHDSMTGKKYRYVFLKGGQEFKDIITGNKEEQFGLISKQPILSFSNDFDTLHDGWVVNAVKEVYDTATTGSFICLFDSAVVYNAGMKLSNDSALVGNEYLYVKCSLQRYDLTRDASLKLIFVAQIMDQSGNTSFYKTFRFAEMPADTSHIWLTDSIGFKMPKLKNLRDELSFYLWNQEQGRFYVDDVSIKIYSFE